MYRHTGSSKRMATLICRLTQTACCIKPAAWFVKPVTMRSVNFPQILSMIIHMR